MNQKIRAKIIWAAFGVGSLYTSPAFCYDYLTSPQLYAKCNNEKDDRAMQRCFGYVEGVTATFISLTVAQLSPDKRSNAVSSAEKNLDSNKVVAQFRKNYQLGKYSGANVGGSLAVVDTILQILKEAKNSGKNQ